MGPLAELLSAGERQTFEFFVDRLKGVAEPTLDHQEMHYNASVLTHYARIGTVAHGHLPAPATLTEVFDQFVFNTSLRKDSTMMEAAGAQCLLLSGFFEDQLRERHNIRWYARLGVEFLRRAAALESSQQRARLLRAIAAHFEPWRQCQARLSRELRDQPYLLDSFGNRAAQD